MGEASQETAISRQVLKGQAGLQQNRGGSVHFNKPVVKGEISWIARGP